jgi:branched-chain amino acid transport system permease protein
VGAGFNLTLIPTGVFNFAYGALVVGGSFLSYQWMAIAQIPIGLAILIIAATMGLVGTLCELITVRPIRKTGKPAGQSMIVTTVGMSTVLIGLYGVKWGYQPLNVPFDGPHGFVRVIGVVAQPVEIVVVTSAICLSIGLHLWFTRTRIGRTSLAVSEDRDAASLRGVNVDRLSVVAFAAAGIFAGLTGLVTGPITYAMPTLGLTLALGGFVALALGGEGSFIGTLIGGLIVGMASSFAARYLGTYYNNISVLGLLLAVLILKPGGLRGASEARRV